MVPNCAVYSDPTTCSKCAKTYKLVGNQCVPINQAQCLSVDSNNICTACSADYVLDSSKNCIQIDPNCGMPVKPQENDYECTYCLQSSFITPTHKCIVPHLTNCQDAYSIDKCYNCEQRYFLQDNQCLPNSYFANECLQVVQVDTNQFMCLNCEN